MYYVRFIECTINIKYILWFRLVKAFPARFTDAVKMFSLYVDFIVIYINKLETCTNKIIRMSLKYCPEYKFIITIKSSCP